MNEIYEKYKNAEDAEDKARFFETLSFEKAKALWDILSDSEKEDLVPKLNKEYTDSFLSYMNKIEMDRISSFINSSPEEKKALWDKLSDYEKRQSINRLNFNNIYSFLFNSNMESVDREEVLKLFDDKKLVEYSEWHYKEKEPNNNCLEHAIKRLKLEIQSRQIVSQRIIFKNNIDVIEKAQFNIKLDILLKKQTLGVLDYASIEQENNNNEPPILSPELATEMKELEPQREKIETYVKELEAKVEQLEAKKEEYETQSTELEEQWKKCKEQKKELEKQIIEPSIQNPELAILIKELEERKNINQVGEELEKMAFNNEPKIVNPGTKDNQTDEESFEESFAKAKAILNKYLETESFGQNGNNVGVNSEVEREPIGTNEEKESQGKGAARKLSKGNVSFGLLAGIVILLLTLLFMIF